MPWNNCADLTAGDVRIPRAQWTTGVLYDRGPRKEAPGRGVAIELPVVLELLDRIADGQITPEQARNAFAPVQADLAVFHQEMDERDRMMDGGAYG